VDNVGETPARIVPIHGLSMDNGEWIPPRREYDAPWGRMMKLTTLAVSAFFP
jgi:hypothetical protein